MGTNASIYNLLFLATISGSSVNLGYDQNYLIPGIKMVSEIQTQNIEDWRMNVLNLSPGYTIMEDESEKLAILCRFSQKLIDYGVDLDSDIVEMVNENFWDLL
ncbi:MAG TPA: hypothetical protein PLD74_09545 [Prolixibacteraceae bacterium]|jgi:hypothetical protein|nr:hypothetical protein [Prolixibacteraceae bacterium]HOF55974.1 hypothetical protein [Prolixibacteraceae bacterium]HOS90482.1 hypothetical protein [Prolixibacteraceae bacterium]HPL45537.1 hypothetical protein [Prolixibacteraceae bacterium]HQE52595.1 hypothetical protein [Prolixibacteraceae bacterium]